ncbi:MAG: CTP synthase [bacterium]
MTKYIFVTGGNVSSLGKGITSATIGRLLKGRGLRVTIQKIDPYINVDAGTMNPYQHGEVFVTEDGAETDLDLGHYERFIDQNLTRNSNVTTGKVYESVIRSEREGKYLGGTVQVIPHITNEIKSCIRQNARKSRAEVVIVEIGGTVGDIESMPFLEAIRQFRNNVGAENSMFVHLTLVPFLHSGGELKTKLTQHTVKELRGIGIQPDMIICRSRRPMKDDLKAKVSLFCDVPKECVIDAVDTDEVYELPLIFDDEGLADLIIRRLGITTDEHDMTEWKEMVKTIRNPEGKVTIGVVGKYVQLRDAYISIREALKHGGIASRAQVVTKLVDSTTLERGCPPKQLEKLNGILVPGGFGYRGIEGKIKAIRFARENDVPFLGICMGLQSAVIEFARNACSLSGANSSELDPDSPHPVIDLMVEQRSVTDMGGTMRLGAFPCSLNEKSIAGASYNARTVDERHRHRYEVNNKYRERLEKHGLAFTGLSPNGELVEIIELPANRYFLATQFHPEFKSRPTRPHPLFASFVKSAVEHSKEKGI